MNLHNLENELTLMNWRLICLFLLLYLLGRTLAAQSQTFTVTGKILDQDNHAALAGVYVSAVNKNDPKITVTVATDKNGIFSIPNLNIQTKYNLKATYIGYTEIELPIVGNSKIVDMGTLILSVRSHPISEVVVKGNPPAAVQKGDTVEMNAGAFLTSRDATAEELVKKMPGITVENGTVKAHGEEVKKVLVDGKDFFGEDPSTALNNLPAEIIDKIQVFDKLSEQAQFTGFDDGQSVKAINIITKQSRQNGEFGKFYAGTDFRGKYIAGGNLNIFNKQRRISFIGMLNNINQQNFSQQDLIGISGAGGKHDAGFTVGQQNGINTTRSFGTNYIDNWGKKINVTGSYFFNSNENNTIQQSKKDKFLPPPKSDHYSLQNDTTSAQKYTHRFNMRIEYDIDSLNSLIMIPKIIIQNGNPREIMSKITTKKDTTLLAKKDTFVNSERQNTKGHTDGYNLANEFLFRHKFNKPKRTISVSLVTSTNRKESNSSQIGMFRDKQTDSFPTNQHDDSNTDNYKLSSNIVYIEPLSEVSMLHLDYSTAFTNSKKDREVFNYSDSGKVLDHIDTLSNIYKCTYFNNHVGMAYRIKTENIKFSLGMDYQYARLDEKQIYLGDFSKGRLFKNFLPNLQFNLKQGSNTSLKILYKTSTNAPNISQLQNVIDNSDRTNLSTGNPLLTQEYDHYLNCNYSYANPENSINSTFIVIGEYDKNYIGTQTITAAKDTFLKDIKLVLKKNYELTRPINLDHFKSFKAIYNFSFPVKWIMSKINLTTAINYSTTPGYITQNLNRYNLLGTTDGIVMSSDISEDIDFSVSYSLNYSVIRNSITLVNPNYLIQTCAAKVTWLFWKGIVIQSDVLGQYEKGFHYYNQHNVLCNAYIGKKLFDGQNGEIKFSVYNLLNKNLNISHEVTPQHLEDFRTNVLTRYFMLTFTYNLRNFRGPADEPKKIKKDKKLKKAGKIKNPE